MKNERTKTSNLFDGKRFQCIETTDATNGQLQRLYTVDGVQVSKVEWEQQQDSAIKLDLERLKK